MRLSNVITETVIANERRHLIPSERSEYDVIPSERSESRDLHLERVEASRVSVKALPQRIFRAEARRAQRTAAEDSRGLAASARRTDYLGGHR